MHTLHAFYYIIIYLNFLKFISENQAVRDVVFIFQYDKRPMQIT